MKLRCGRKSSHTYKRFTMPTSSRLKLPHAARSAPGCAQGLPESGRWPRVQFIPVSNGIALVGRIDSAIGCPINLRTPPNIHRTSPNKSSSHAPFHETSRNGRNAMSSPTTKPARKYLSKPDLAERYSRSVKTIYRWLEINVLPEPDLVEQPCILGRGKARSARPPNDDQGRRQGDRRLKPNLEFYDVPDRVGLRNRRRSYTPRLHLPATSTAGV